MRNFFYNLKISGGGVALLLVALLVVSCADHAQTTATIRFSITSPIDSKTLVPNGFSGVDSFRITLSDTTGKTVANLDSSTDTLVVSDVLPGSYTVTLEGLSSDHVVTRDVIAITVAGGDVNVPLTARTIAPGTGSLSLTIVGNVPEGFTAGAIPMNARLVKDGVTVREDVLTWSETDGELSVPWSLAGLETGAYALEVTFASLEASESILVLNGQVTSGMAELNVESAEKVATPVISLVEEASKWVGDPTSSIVISNGFFLTLTNDYGETATYTFRKDGGEGHNTWDVDSFRIADNLRIQLHPIGMEGSEIKIYLSWSGMVTYFQTNGGTNDSRFRDFSLLQDYDVSFNFGNDNTLDLMFPVGAEGGFNFIRNRDAADPDGIASLSNHSLKVIREELRKEVSISCATPDASIRYTLDDSEPIEASASYGGPIEVTTGITVKARAFKEGMEASEVAEYTVEEVAKKLPTPIVTNDTGRGLTVIVEGIEGLTQSNFHFTPDGANEYVGHYVLSSSSGDQYNFDVRSSHSTFIIWITCEGYLDSDKVTYNSGS